MGKKNKKKDSSDAPDSSQPLPRGFSTSETHDVDHVTASLKAIYDNPPDGSGGDLKKLVRSRRPAWLIALLSLAAFLTMLAGVAWAGYVWWSGRVQGGGLQTAIEGPSHISIGQETTFVIHWFNRSRGPLASSELRITFPNDFSLSAAEPAPTNKNDDGTSLTYQLGAQPTEARGTVKVTGTFTGALGTKSAIQVIGTYRPVGSTQGKEKGEQFETLETKELEYEDSVLDGALDLPAKVLPGDHVIITYHITNKGTNPLEGLEARMTLPDGFVPDPLSATSTATLEEGAIRIPLGMIEKDASSTVRVMGSFALGAHGDTAVHAEAGRTLADGSFAAAQKTDGVLSVLAGDLNIDMVINGSKKDRSVSLGERQRVAISYENTSGESLRDVTLRFRFAVDPASSETVASLVDWDELDDPTEGMREDDTVTYTMEEIGQLEELPPDGNGTLEFSVPLRSELKSGKDVPLLASVEAIIGSVDDVEVNRTVATKPITLRLQTDAELSAIARYTSEEGAPIGSGPLPPVAGTGTTYRIEWTITKTLHALDRITVSANLPKGVSFDSVKENDGGEVAYDADRRLITWTVGNIAEDADETRASFDVTLIPSEADIGRFAQLLGESRFEFTDTDLQESLLRTAPGFSTDLSDDPLAKGKGVVKR